MSDFKWLRFDDELDETSMEEITSVLKLFLWTIPVISIILSAVNFALGLNEIALSILILPLFCFISLWFLKRGNLNVAMAILIIVLVVTATASCVLGNGIHETGMIVFPMIILFSSIVMNVRGVLATSFLVIGAIALIVYTEQYTTLGIFPVPRARLLDLVAVICLLIIHAIVTHNLSRITQTSLERSLQELDAQELIKQEVEDNLNQKSLLLRQVHHRVKNHLSLLTSLIDIESMQLTNGKEKLKELSNSIHTIARAHDPLYHTEDYKQVSVKPYFEKLTSSFSQSNGLNQIELKMEDGLIFHETALSAGIILQEILKIISKSGDPSMTITLQIAQNLTLEVALNNQEIDYIDGSIESSLINLLAADLEADAELGRRSIKLSFDMKNHKG